MADRAFRVKIGRVRWKGPVVGVISPVARPMVLAHMREWLEEISGYDRAPDGYAAVAFWIDPKFPGQPDFQVAYLSHHDALTAPLLADMAAGYIRREVNTMPIRNRILGELGYDVGWTPPDETA